MPKLTDALTHTDAFLLYNPHTRTHPHTHGKPLYKKVRQDASVRQSSILDDLANAVQRLTIDRCDPEKFHQDKSEIVAALRRMARGAKQNG